ncbi:MAG: ABC transporter ATP-binding protein [Bacillota bacterium]|nr:ABC transporter ATP-binding protein [Bacillota bacterium]
MLKVIDITKIYQMGDNTVNALAGITLHINTSEFISIMGPSGSGKSTMMNILGCLDQPSAGSYLIDNIDVSGLTSNQLAEVRNKKIGFVFQSFNLLARTNALENVELPMLYQGISAKNRRRRAIEALERVGLSNRLYHHPKELSGGQQQRVAIARALVNNPAVILADEPTGNLDSKSSQEIMAILQELNNEGKTIIIVTHEQDIAQFTKRIVKFIDGRIINDANVLAQKDAKKDLLYTSEVGR